MRNEKPSHLLFVGYMDDADEICELLTSWTDHLACTPTQMVALPIQQQQCKNYLPTGLA